ncbi:MAG: hypothetical protein AAGE86_15005, partial [Pseudomonadota bacterium]
GQEPPQQTSSQGSQSSGQGGNTASSDPRYGNSPGSGQASPQPYLAQENGDETDTAWRDEAGNRTEASGEYARENGLFA